VDLIISVLKFLRAEQAKDLLLGAAIPSCFDDYHKAADQIRSIEGKKFISIET
jgi:hypothetical protein